MQQVRLGRTSLRVSRLSVGSMGFGDTTRRSWVLALDDSSAVFRCALDSGISVLDTCDYFSAGLSETIVGTLVAEAGSRADLVIATKAGNPMANAANARGYSRKHLFEAVEQSLRRLKTDYIDTYQTHIWDPATDLGEMMDAYDDLVRSGKVLYVGITDMSFWQFALAQTHAARLGRARFASVQNHYNLLWHEDERELLPYCRAEGIGLIPYSPMARGFLCGRARRVEGSRTERAKTDDFTYKLYGRDADGAVVDAVAVVAAARGVTSAQIALAWVVAQPGVSSLIIGATFPGHIDQAVAALDIHLTPAECAASEAPCLPRPHRS
jgi:aryl-alcohol dehydrogenase-like predicted oxidoreductase